MKRFKGLKKLSLADKNSAYGYIFILPWVIGFLLFVMYPLIQSLWFSFNDVRLRDGGFNLSFLGFDNYLYAINEHKSFRQDYLTSLSALLYELPAITVFSLFMAALVKRKFVGRTVVRAILFLPVVISSGVVMEIFKQDVMASALMSTSGSMFSENLSIMAILKQAGFSEVIITFFTTLNQIVVDIMWKSGMQIIIFLAGLQNIPSSLYEASRVEGANAWENFWFITFPMLIPVLVVNLIYTIIDNFTNYGNAVMLLISAGAKEMEYGISSAISWMFFLTIFIIILTIFLISVRKERIANKRGVVR